jgi:hypothetical protein
MDSIGVNLHSDFCRRQHEPTGTNSPAVQPQSNPFASTMAQPQQALGRQPTVRAPVSQPPAPSRSFDQPAALQRTPTSRGTSIPSQPTMHHPPVSRSMSTSEGLPQHPPATLIRSASAAPAPHTYENVPLNGIYLLNFECHW